MHRTAPSLTRVSVNLKTMRSAAATVTVLVALTIVGRVGYHSDGGSSSTQISVPSPTSAL